MRTRAAILALVLISLPLAGQTFISAKAGLVNYEEGVQAASPRQLQEGEVFSTPNRSELLMMPGAYLRLERSAEVRLLSTSVSHPAVELLSGLVSVEVNEMTKESSLTLNWGDYRDAQGITIAHRGLYRFEVAQDGSSLKVMVQTGQLHIGDKMMKDGEGVLLSPGRVASAGKFDRKLRDDFDIWAANRDQVQSVASYRTASAVGSTYYAGSGFMGGMGYGTWAFNPMMGFFTYLPFGMVTSPWGYYYYSPGQVGYYPFPYYGYGYGSGYGYGYGYGNNGGRSSVASVIGSTPSSQTRFPVYGTTGGSNVSGNGFAGSTSRSGATFANSSPGTGFSSNSASSVGSSGSSSGFGGSARAGTAGGGGSGGGGTPTRH
jgi:hypothetical protein